MSATATTALLLGALLGALMAPPWVDRKLRPKLQASGKRRAEWIRTAPIEDVDAWWRHCIGVALLIAFAVTLAFGLAEFAVDASWIEPVRWLLRLAMVMLVMTAYTAWRAFRQGQRNAIRRIEGGS